MQPIYTGEPFERVTMDIIGPLPITDRGNRYIFTVVDHFTKQVEAYALADQEATIVAQDFLNEFVSRYGVPYVLHTDQGANFESNLFNELCQMLNIKKTRTTPYDPQCDGQVERMNRTIIDLLKLNVRDATNNWDFDNKAHFDRLKRATVKPRVHKLSESELEPSSSCAKEEDLSDYTPIHRQPAKPINAKIDAAKSQAPLEQQNARAMTPRKASQQKTRQKLQRHLKSKQRQWQSKRHLQSRQRKL